MILNIERKNLESSIVVLELSGRIAMGSDSQKIEWSLSELLKENRKKVIFALTNVTFIDSSGVGILVMCHARLKKAGGALHIAGPQGMVKETLELTSVNKIVPVYPNSAEAAQQFQLA